MFANRAGSQSPGRFEQRVLQKRYQDKHHVDEYCVIEKNRPNEGNFRKNRNRYLREHSESSDSVRVDVGIGDEIRDSDCQQVNNGPADDLVHLVVNG